ncbi:hypothetical protein [Rhizobium hainanense]|uniref:Uncharacterized protein n=1 Tax=Rhizobium hainanense TaxID=52131 RepID=A0A1C3V2E8_9HYPH|nr:hypothetical protein [Rhizobium hainanense]SCB21829.1 hypothetical protein GA0061100_104157 [Rhizobium hainanense]
MAQIDTDDRIRGERMKEEPLHKHTARQQQNRHQHRRALFDEVIRLNGMGWSQLAIKREFGVDLKTIRKWVKDNQPGTWERKIFPENPADAYADYVCRRWLEGCRNATRLYREVCDRCYSESVKTFRQWVKVRLRDGVPAPAVSRASRKSSWRTPSSRQTVRLLTAEIDTFPPSEPL